MKINNETDFIKKILRPYLEGRGYKVHKHTERFSRGYPDLSAVKDGETIYIEAKIAPKDATSLQMKELEDLAKHGARAFTVIWFPFKEIWIVYRIFYDGSIQQVKGGDESWENI